MGDVSLHPAKMVPKPMSHDTFELIFFLALLLILGAWYFVQIRHFVLRFRSKRWPIVNATVQRGCVGKISVGKGGSIPAAFLGYAYLVQGVRYVGLFAVCGDDPKVRKLNEGLPGCTIQVRYDPSSPDRSFLVNESDPRFEELTASQNPDRLEQSPSFDLQDAIR
jgi:hypothetical protein